MIYKYNELGVDFVEIFYINNSNTVSKVKGFSRKATVVCLYNIENKNFEYYIYEPKDNLDKYYSLYEAILACSKKEDEDNLNKEQNLDQNTINNTITTSFDIYSIA